ncbi:carbohydrate ABC transporter permease [Paenibacillus filicis]|uniref:Carbohydrate ABC transporter permease n=1 Tax=Paenibacillus gyeongsangnamensis TaxID=3388067 RepID=A0ABT4QHE1_9BACL|nr:carbohydrate ABC transporter permease [Paenibacillus filicis]MCZ8516260.1 carbohydrate ABC transporter permease [Paenibacillus filicis]
MEMKRTQHIWLVYSLLILISIGMIMPFFWMVTSSLKPLEHMMSDPIRWFEWPPLWSNYPKALKTIPFWNQLGNTVLLSVMSVLGTVLSSSMVAYGLAKIDWPGRKLLFSVLLATMFLPGFVTFVPTYLIFRDLGWLGTYLPLIVPTFLGVPYYIFVLRQFFLTIPESVTEAARIDAASDWRIFWQIILPLSKPALTTVALLSFVGAWTDYTGPLIYLSTPDHWTLSLGLKQFLNTHNADWNLLMAASVVFTLPMVIIFFLGQKYFMEGITFHTDVG